MAGDLLNSHVKKNSKTQRMLEQRASDGNLDEPRYQDINF